ncbi:hypothetical protein YC2023_118284 [Brassica napus]
MADLGQIRHVQGSDLKNGEAMTRLVCVSRDNEAYHISEFISTVASKKKVVLGSHSPATHMASALFLSYSLVFSTVLLESALSQTKVFNQDIDHRNSVVIKRRCRCDISTTNLSFKKRKIRAYFKSWSLTQRSVAEQGHCMQNVRQASGSLQPVFENAPELPRSRPGKRWACCHRGVEELIGVARR